MSDKEELQKAIGQRIKQIGESKNIAQQNLAASCNFEKSNLARLEARNTNSTLYNSRKFKGQFRGFSKRP